MTTQETPAAEVTEVVEETSATSDGPKELRDALKRKTEEAAEYRGQLMTGAYDAIGLNPETGLGKAIAKEYEGDPTAEALAEYAEAEYGFKAEETPENPKAPAIEGGQKQIDAVNAQSESITPGSESEALKEAQSKGDYATAGAIKANQLERMLKRQ